MLRVFRRLASNSLFKFIPLFVESAAVDDEVAAAADAFVTAPAAPALFVRTLRRVEIICFSSLCDKFDILETLLEQFEFTGEDDVVEFTEAAVFVPFGVDSKQIINLFINVKKCYILNLIMHMKTKTHSDFVYL